MKSRDLRHRTWCAVLRVPVLVSVLSCFNLVVSLPCPVSILSCLCLAVLSYLALCDLCRVLSLSCPRFLCSSRNPMLGLTLFVARFPGGQAGSHTAVCGRVVVQARVGAADRSQPRKRPWHSRKRISETDLMTCSSFSSLPPPSFSGAREQCGDHFKLLSMPCTASAAEDQASEPAIYACRRVRDAGWRRQQAATEPRGVAGLEVRTAPFEGVVLMRLVTFIATSVTQVQKHPM